MELVGHVCGLPLRQRVLGHLVPETGVEPRVLGHRLLHMFRRLGRQQRGGRAPEPPSRSRRPLAVAVAAVAKLVDDTV